MVVGGCDMLVVVMVLLLMMIGDVMLVLVLDKNVFMISS
jgi:hypothetical protein